MIFLKQYNDTFFNLSEVSDKLFHKREKRTSPNCSDFYEEEKQRISLSRSLRHIKEICLCNNFEYFVTMTVSSKLEYYNRFDLEDCLDNCRKIMYKLRRKNRDFKYIFIIEKHLNGAYHFHGMMKCLPVNDIYINENGFFSSKTLDRLGFNSFSKIKDYNKCCNYITKYITEECIQSDSGRRYFCSNGLRLSTREFMMPVDLKQIFPDVYENNYCLTRDFDIDKLSKRQRIQLYNYFCENEEFMDDLSISTKIINHLTILINKDIINTIP